MFLALPIGLLIRMALNALDGMIAREYNQQSRTGEVLNEVGDIFSDFCIYFPLLKHEPDSVYWVACFMCLSIVNEFSGLMGKLVGGERRYDGPMGKSDRAFVISVYGLICFFYGSPIAYFNVAAVIVIILLVISTITRLKKSV